MAAASRPRPRPAPARDYSRRDYYVVQTDDSTSPQLVASHLGMRLEGRLSALDGHHVLSAPKAPGDDVVRRRLQERRRRKRHAGGRHVLDGVLLAAKQEPRMHLEKRAVPPRPVAALLPPRSGSEDAAAVQEQTQFMGTLGISDPIFRKQWHLYNTVQVGHDVNVTGLWLQGINGLGATVAIIDDGIDMHSNDLKDNYFAQGSWDFNDSGPEPKPRLSDDRHGTRCAGEVAAVRNDVCGLGVAYKARVAGIRILSKPISDADEADAMVYKYQDNQIYSCSWGPRDDGASMEAPGILIQRAMLQAIQKGRGGLGTLYVFASGNGAASDDNCNFDGYTNSIYSITVGAVDRAGRHPYYSEHCSAQLVVTYSSGHGDYIHTTDVGADTCATGHGGTSAAAPLAAGIFALVMQVRPDLSWRDFQYLAMDTAVPMDEEKDSWQRTAIGKQFSHVFGYGKIDSYALVEKAKGWQTVKPQAWYFSPWLHVKQAIPEGQHGLVSNFEITGDMVKEANLGRIEHVTVTMNVNHTRRGDISVDLISPHNVTSHIATSRRQDNHVGGYEDWTFMTVAHWGESGVGNWSIVVRDTHENEHNGTFVDWHLKLWGESTDASRAVPLPMPNDDDHDKTVSTVSATVQPSMPVTPRPTPVVLPTDHPQRPTKPGPKPTTTAVSTGTPPVSPPTEAKTAGPVWIYGALCLIVVFCIGLGTYLWLARRRRLRNKTRDSYEFELLDGDDGLDAGRGGEKPPPGGTRGRRTRGGELYDAFAGGSDDGDGGGDDDDDVGEYSDDDDAGRYVVGEESDDGEDEDAGDGVDEKSVLRPSLGGAGGVH